MANEIHEAIEELSQELRDQLKLINALRQEIELLKKTVADEQEQKYRALIQVADLQKQIRTKPINFDPIP